MKRRQEYRQHSKSTLLKATETLFREREVLLLVERRRWRRRLAWAVAAALIVGAALGYGGGLILGAGRATARIQ